MIYKGDDTPYAQAAKEKASDSVAALIFSDAEVNDSIMNLITESAIVKTMLNSVESIVSMPDYPINNHTKVEIVRAILGITAKGVGEENT